MSFLSFPFAIFAGLGLLAFYFGPKGWRVGTLLALSYGFYLTWSVFYGAMLLLVTLGVYAAGRGIEAAGGEGRKRGLMILSVSLLVLLLLGFKSAGWIAREFFARADGFNPAGAILLPLGLSYYIFKMVGYLLDVYWEAMPAQRSFAAVALYGAFFPQIVSGPIERAENFFTQLQQLDAPDSEAFLIGLRRILFGLFKKIAIADTLAVVVQNAHAHPASFSPLELVVAAYCFAIELYMDFSGITDIAIGLGLLFGIRGPENFDLPYFTPNIQLFWRRLHMSLTSWLRDYLFTPLRMSLRRWGTAGLCLAIFINTTAIGLWHGLTWTFLIFGAMHGVFVIVSVLTMKQRNAFFQGRPPLAQMRGFVAPVIVFHLVVFSLIFFRADSFSSAAQYVAGLVPGRSGVSAWRFDTEMLGLPGRDLAWCAFGYLLCEAVTWAGKKPFWQRVFFRAPALLRRAVYTALIISVLLLFKGGLAFIYAQF